MSNTTCNLCNKFTSSQKILTCEHRFCSRCLAKPSAWGGQNGVTCPKCGAYSKQHQNSLPPLQAIDASAAARASKREEDETALTSVTPDRNLPTETAPITNARTHSSAQLPQLHKPPADHSKDTPEREKAKESVKTNRILTSPRDREMLFSPRAALSVVSPSEAVTQCELCEDEKPTHKCMVCERSMCGRCTKTHKRIPVTTNHQVRALSALHREHFNHARATLEKYQRYQAQAEERNNLFQKYKRYLNALNTDICSEIDRAANAAKQKLLNCIDHLADTNKKQVRSSITNEMDLLSDKEGLLTSDLEEVKGMIVSLQQVMKEPMGRSGSMEQRNSDDAISELTKRLNEEIVLQSKLQIMVVPNDFEDYPTEVELSICDVDITRTDIILLDAAEELRRSKTFQLSPRVSQDPDQEKPADEETKVSAQNTRTDTPFVAKKSSSLLPKRSNSNVHKRKTPETPPKENKKSDKSAALREFCKDFNGLTTTRISHKSLAKSTTKNWLLKNSINIQEACDSFCIIDSRFWCVSRSSHTITVYSCDGRLTTTITQESMKYPCAVALCRKAARVLVACVNNFGLLSLHPDGSFHTTVATGSFSDVLATSEKVIALENEPCRVRRFAYNDKEDIWWHEKEIELDFMTGNLYDSLCYANSTYYVSSIKHKCIFLYSELGEVLDTRRCFLPGGFGSFHLVTLSMADREGTLLLVDLQRTRLLALTEDNRPLYHELEHRPAVSAALMDEHGFLWVMHGNIIARYQAEFPLPNLT